MKCYECGAELPDNSSFCRNCGSQVISELPQETNPKYPEDTKTPEQNSTRSYCDTVFPQYKNTYITQYQKELQREKELSSEEAYHTQEITDTEDRKKPSSKKKTVIIAAVLLLVGALTYAAISLELFGGSSAPAVAAGEIAVTKIDGGEVSGYTETLTADDYGRIVKLSARNDDYERTVSYEYSDYGLITYIYEEHFSGGELEYIGTEEYIYDGELLTDWYSSSQWDLSEEPTVYEKHYSYDSEGLLLSMSYYLYGNSGIYYYEYDDSGKLVTVSSEGGTSYDVYTYDSEGRLIEKDYYYDGQFGGCFEYSYNSEGKLLEASQRSLDANSSSYTRFEYDSNGLIIAVDETGMFDDTVYRTEYSPGITLEIYKLMTDNSWE